MPLAASGTISIGGSTSGRSINLEFGRAAGATTSMSQLYRNGGIVGSGAPNVPTSGPISLSQFYGAANRIAQTITLSANQTNYVLNTAKVAGYQAGLMDVTLVINSGVYVSANSTGVYALDVDTSWAAGDSVTIVNNGFIVGMGGAGGAGQSINPSGITSGGSAGAGGGPALRVQRSVSFNNAGTIGSGGGGGGGGQAHGTYVNDNWNTRGGSGGGGGRTGATNSSGGAGGSTSGLAGNAGTASSAGAGRSAYTFGAYNQFTVAASAGGGTWGASGGSALFSGGGGGTAVAGNGNISWVATGTRLGAIT